MGGSPEGPGGRAWGGAWRPRGRPRAADDRRPAEADQSRAGGGRRRGKASGPATGSRQPVTPHSPRHATGGSTPARPAAGGGRKAVVAGATGEGAWGGGGGGARSTPSPAPANPTSRDVAGRRPGREEGRTTHTAREETTPPGGGRGGGRPRPRGRGRMEGAEGWGAGGGRAGRGGAGRQLRRAAFPKPEPPPPKLCTPPPPNKPFSRSSSPPSTTGAGHPPSTQPHGAGRLPGEGLSLFPPFFPSHPAPHGWRRGSRAGRGEATDTALGTDHVNDPSAGSPTETLLRLLLPLDSQVRPSSQRSARAVGRPRRGRSEGLTKPSNR